MGRPFRGREIKYKKPTFQCILYQECGFLYLISGVLQTCCNLTAFKVTMIGPPTVDTTAKVPGVGSKPIPAAAVPKTVTQHGDK
eukprot:2860091-Rhodomonas_salina.1